MLLLLMLLLVVVVVVKAGSRLVRMGNEADFHTVKKLPTSGCAGVRVVGMDFKKCTLLWSYLCFIRLVYNEALKPNLMGPTNHL